LIDLPIPATSALTVCITLWSKSFIGNDIRDFSFKCRFDYLALNSRRAAYDPDANPLCSFCRIRDHTLRIRESFEHLFFSCPTATGIINYLLDNYFNLVFDSIADKKNFIWNGIIEGNGNENCQFLLFFFWEAYRFLLYRYKLKKHIPNPVSIKNELFFIVKTTIMRIPQFQTKITGTELFARWLPALG
jgi:hypothetical protein